ncbi:YcgL domain-containing protein [Aurantivibrio plasticivorans]
MKVFCDIYKSSREKELYVYIKFGTSVDDLPEPLREKLGQPSKVMSLELSPERKLARADVNRVIQQIEEVGFYLQLPPSPFAQKDTE